MYTFELEGLVRKKSGGRVFGGGLRMQGMEFAGETPAPLMLRRNLETGETPVLRDTPTEHGREPTSRGRFLLRPSFGGQVEGQAARATLVAGSGRLTSTSVLYNRAL